jgi:hypothetical protein
MWAGSEEAVEMTIVMGLDQHRAQITAEWLNTATGEIKRSRVAPAHRDGVRRFCEQFRGQELEVALEPRPGGGSSLMNCAASTRTCTWPSQRRPRRVAGTRSERRATARTRGISV